MVKGLSAMQERAMRINKISITLKTAFEQGVEAIDLERLIHEIVKEYGCTATKAMEYIKEIAYDNYIINENSITKA